MIGLVDEIDLEIAEIDIPRGNVLLIEGGEEVENIETGETIPMTGQEDAARTLLTRGPVVEEMIIVERHQVDLWPR